MNKEIGKLYWCPEQECVVELLNINADSRFPYNYKYIDCDETDDADELWDKEEALEEIADLEYKTNALQTFVDIVKEM